MNIKKILIKFNILLDSFIKFDFIALLCLRLYLVPVLFVAARSKILGFHTTVAWFAAPVSKGGLNMQFPELMASLTVATEACGLVCIALGFCVRLISIPLAVVMGVAAFAVHIKNGWPMLAERNMESTLRLQGLMAWLAQNFPGRYNYTVALGDPIMLNNGIEISTGYLIMFLVLFCFGGGRYVSIDYWIKKYATQNDVVGAKQ